MRGRAGFWPREGGAFHSTTFLIGASVLRGGEWIASGHGNFPEGNFWAGIAPGAPSSGTESPGAYFAGREPVIRMSTSLLALCCQSGLDAT